MPRGDGTGPMGNGPIGRGRNNSQGMNFGRKIGMFGTNNNNVPNKDSLEDQAAQLEEQAAKLRKLAKQTNNNE